jgi:hypothetical protein
LGLSHKRRGDTRDKHDCCNTRHKKLLVVLPFMLRRTAVFMLCERHFVGGPMHNSRNCGNYGAGSRNSDKPFDKHDSPQTTFHEVRLL